jgi:hypothetical protein
MLTPVNDKRVNVKRVTKGMRRSNSFRHDFKSTYTIMYMDIIKSCTNVNDPYESNEHNT